MYVIRGGGAVEAISATPSKAKALREAISPIALKELPDGLATEQGYSST